MKKKLLVSLCAVISQFYASSMLSANDDVESIRVVGRNINLVGSAISASEGVVSQSEIRLKPLSRSGEVLELVPGMVATQHSGSGKANQLFLRGFNLDHGTDFATSVDSMPVNMRTHGHGQGYTDINFIIPELIDNIAYKKGSYYAEVGDFSAAGSANFTSSSRLSHGVAKLTAGSNNYLRLLVADSVSDVVKGDLLYAIELQQYDGPWDDINEDVAKTNVLVKHSSRWQDGDLTFSLMAYNNSWNSADQIPERAVNAGVISEFGSIDDSVGGDSSRYSVSASWNAEHASWSAYAIDYQLDLYSNFTYFLDDPVNGDQFQQVDERMIYGAQGHYHFDQGNMRNTIGADIRYDDISKVGLYKTQQRQLRGAVKEDEVAELSVGLYVKNTLHWTDRLRTTVGLRYDYFDFDVNSLVATNVNGVDVNGNGGSNQDGIASLKGSATYEINASNELYASIGQGFHSNDARGTTINVDPNSGDPVDSVDPLVASLGYEVGMRSFINDSLNMSVSLWRIELDSELLFVGDAGNTEPNRASTRQGLEFTSYYHINEIWTADVEYSYAHSRFNRSSDGVGGGDYIPGSMENVIQMGISGQWTNGWYGSLRWRYFGERPLLEDASVKSSSTSVVNGLVGFEQEKYVITLELFNILDSNDRDIEYFYESQLTGESSAVDDRHYHVIEPRSVRMSASYKF